jgi:serine/threonine-protein kinase
MARTPRTRRPAPRALAGRYVLLDRVASGGMGAVWRARDLRTGRPVAVKVLHHHGSEHLLRFVREQSVRVRHPHVVAPTGWAAEDDVVVLTMDLVRGGSLQALLDEHGPLPRAYVAVLLDQVLQALEAIHGAGVVHRDLKPANLLLEATGTGRPVVRVGDFGVAALMHDVRLTRVPGAVGTDGYMAPEQADGAGPDPRQDLYAAGVVAAQLLTGRTPGPTGPDLAGVDGGLAPLLAALTSPDPGRRPGSATEALVRLRRTGVPAAAPWQAGPRPPRVPDRLGPEPDAQQDARPGVRAADVAIACFAATLLLCAAAVHLLLR